MVSKRGLKASTPCVQSNSDELSNSRHFGAFSAGSIQSKKPSVGPKGLIGPPCHGGIYIHIPFCKRGCFYCHFFKREYETNLVDKYIRALAAEIQLKSNPGYIVDSIYIGGGSPSLLNEHQVTAVVGAVVDHFQIDPAVECTIEVNPEDVSPDKLRCWKEIGINRLSIGTQSFLTEDLNYLKRTHHVNQSINAIKQAIKLGFFNINVDFIISLPTQTRETLADNLSILKNFNIPHVSAYLLEEVEESEKKNIRDNDLYFFTRDFLSHLGYTHYEISNFSQPGFRCRHNLKYWNNQSYIGVGISASGYEKGWDYKNTTDFNWYFKKIEQGNLPHAGMETPDLKIRRIVMGLRLLEGISIDYFNGFREESDFLLSNGFLVRRGRRIAVNPGKLLLLNEILTYFMPARDDGCVETQ